MAVEIQSTIKPKGYSTGGGQFFLVNAEDVDVKSGGEGSSFPSSSLSMYLDELETRLTEYIKGLSVLGSLISFTKGDGNEGSFNTTWIGTREEYEAANSENKIPVGTIVVITDEVDEDINDDTGNDDDINADATSSILGVGVLGQMILG